VRTRPKPLTPRVSDVDREAHRAFIATLGESAIWLGYRE
jgi:DNA polymerase-3 subunit epsilon